MLSEQIVIGQEERCRADNIIIPDIRYAGVFVDSEKQHRINHAYRTAVRTLRTILERRKKDSSSQWYEIDVLDFNFLIKQVTKDIQNDICRFYTVFVSLVDHLIPEAEKYPYSLDKVHRHGVRYEGLAWV